MKRVKWKENVVCHDGFLRIALEVCVLCVVMLRVLLFSRSSWVRASRHHVLIDIEMTFLSSRYALYSSYMFHLTIWPPCRRSSAGASGAARTRMFSKLGCGGSSLDANSHGHGDWGVVAFGSLALMGWWWWWCAYLNVVGWADMVGFWWRWWARQSQSASLQRRRANIMGGGSLG